MTESNSIVKVDQNIHIFILSNKFDRNLLAFLTISNM